MGKNSKKTPRIDPQAFADALRVDTGFRLEDVDPAGTPAFDGKKADGEAALAENQATLDTLLEQLGAQRTAGSTRSALLVVQGMDTAGKGGIMSHVVTANPEGVRATAFKAPTEEERAHDFLWRIRRALPAPGQLGVFDRSQYEDVLIVRVHDLVPKQEWETRYATINAFERELVAEEMTVVKVMLHISKDEQKQRLLQRLERPDKYWKYNPKDVDERELWDDYMQAYQVALTRCSTKDAPWFVVPADRKWYARLAVQQLLIAALRDLDLQWPPATFDVALEKERVLNS